jgi:hypothetical protein
MSPLVQAVATLPYWVGLVLAITVLVAAIVLIARSKGTDQAAGDVKFKGLSIGKLSGSGLLAVLAFLAAGGCVYKLATASSDSNAVRISHVTSVQNAPEPPQATAKADQRAAIGHYLLEWYDQAQINVDVGSEAGISRGDYFATIADAKKAEGLSGDQIANLQDSTTAILKVVRVGPRSSVAQLKELLYEKFFAAHPGSLALVVEGDPVIAVPAREVDLRDQIQDAQENAHPAEVLRLAGRFIDRHPNGFFTAEVLFTKGYTQFRMERYRAAAATFRTFLDRYPFTASAPGARDYLDEAAAKAEGQESR